MTKISVDKSLRKAKSLVKKGDNQGAIEQLNKILEAYPNNKQAQNELRKLGASTNNGQIEPPQQLVNQLIQLLQNKQFNKITTHSKKLTSEYPSSAIIWNIIGAAYAQSGHPAQAAECFQRATEINPQDTQALVNLGTALIEIESFTKAIAVFEKAITINPNNITAHYNIGVIQSNLGNLDQASGAYEKALLLAPDSIEVSNNLGDIYRRQGDYERAVKTYRQSLQYTQNNKTKFNLGLALLSLGELEEGFELYEARDSILSPPIECPRWNKERDKTVLTWGEQGIGDEIMFASCIKDLYNHTKQPIWVQTDERLIPLFKRSFPRDITFIPKGSAITEQQIDSQIPMGSIKKCFLRNRKVSTKAAQAYITPDIQHSAHLKSKLKESDNQILVGISWKTNSKAIGAHERVLPTLDLFKHLNNPKIKLVNLQYGDVTQELNELNSSHNIHISCADEVDNKNDIDGLAALIHALDLVVSIDNATVHLSGSLGTPTIVLLPYACDWRWGTNTQHSYWYESVKLIRQNQNRDWSDALIELQEEILNYIKPN